MGKVSLNLPRYGREMPSAVIAQKPGRKRTGPLVSVPSSVTIGDRVSAAEEVDRGLDSYYETRRHQEFTRHNPETGRTEPITPPCPSTPEDLPEEDREGRSAETQIIPYSAPEALPVAMLVGGDRKRRRITPAVVGSSAKAVGGADRPGELRGGVAVGAPGAEVAEGNVQAEEPSAEAIGEEKVAEGEPLEFSFQHSYEGRIPFLESSRACGNLFNDIQPVAVEETIPISSPEEKRLFREMAQRSFQAVASTNALLDYHRRQLRKAVRKGDGDLWSERNRSELLERQVADLKEKVGRLEGSEEQAADLSEKIAEMKRLEESRSAELAQSRGENEALKAEVKRLQDRHLASRDLWCRKVRETKSDMLTMFEARQSKMRKFIEDQERVQPVVMLLNQATAVLDSYLSLADIGIAIPPELVEKCRADVEEFSRKLDAEDVVTSDELDLGAKSLRDQVAEMDRDGPAQYQRT